MLKFKWFAKFVIVRHFVGALQHVILQLKFIFFTKNRLC
jgi:hypothetical protein